MLSCNLLYAEAARLRSLKIDPIDAAMRLCEFRWCEILRDPTDPSYTEHFAELQWAIRLLKEA